MEINITTYYHLLYNFNLSIITEFEMKAAKKNISNIKGKSQPTNSKLPEDMEN